MNERESAVKAFIKNLCREHGIAIVEDEWRSFNIDDPVMFKTSSTDQKWSKGHFAGVSSLSGKPEDDLPYVFQGGGTSFTTSTSKSVYACRRPTDAELGA